MHLRTMRTLIAVLLGVSRLAYAGCDVTPEHNGPPDTFHASKPWPVAPDRSIVATATFQQGSGFSQPEEVGIGLYDLEVMVQDDTGAHETARGCFKGALPSDAIELDGLSIDTGRYVLAHGVRAFGVRAHNTHTSRASPSEIERLYLYVQKDDKVVPILGPLDMETSFGESDGQDTGSSRVTHLSIDMAKTSHHGYADLVVTETYIESQWAPKAESAQGEDSKTEYTKRYTLEFDGATYPLPAELKAL